MNKERGLILVGGGGHCKSVIEVAESAGYSIKGIIDKAELVGSSVLGYPVIGTDNEIALFVDDADFVVTVGHIRNADLRKQLTDTIKTAGGHLATLIAPSAYVSVHATIEAGSVVMHQAVVNASAYVGCGCIINTFANVEHDAVVEDFCHISTGAMVNGNCIVGQGTFLGSQSVMVNGVRIIEGCVIAAGSVVRKSILRCGIYSGNPALLKIKL